MLTLANQRDHVPVTPKLRADRGWAQRAAWRAIAFAWGEEVWKGNKYQLVR